MDNNGKNIIVEKSFGFALKIVVACELLEEKRKYIIGRQLLKSGTSIGANIWEAQGAESRADFIHKLKIAYKEAEETEYWLLICLKSQSMQIDEALLIDLKELKKILAKIILTSRQSIK